MQIKQQTKGFKTCFFLVNCVISDIRNIKQVAKKSKRRKATQKIKISVNLLLKSNKNCDTADKNIISSV